MSVKSTFYILMLYVSYWNKDIFKTIISALCFVAEIFFLTTNIMAQHSLPAISFFKIQIKTRTCTSLRSTSVLCYRYKWPLVLIVSLDPLIVNPSCMDQESPSFQCADLEKYNFCHDTASVAYAIAHEKCPKHCGFCSPYHLDTVTMAPAPTTSMPTTMTPTDAPTEMTTTEGMAETTTGLYVNFVTLAQDKSHTKCIMNISLVVIHVQHRFKKVHFS